MAITADEVTRLQRLREELRTRLAPVSDMRPGSLVERFRRCGKSNCRCARPGAEAHGPTWSLTWAEGGKTFTRVIPAGPAVEETRRQIAEYQRFRKVARAFIEVNQGLCDARLGAEREARAEKGGSVPRSRRRSRGKSRSS